MDSKDSISRSELSLSEAEVISDPLLVEESLQDAIQDWVSELLGYRVDVRVNEDLIRRAYRLSLLGRAFPLTFDQARSDLYERIDAIATVVSIYARLDPSRRDVLSRLAMDLYLMALQPTKAQTISAPVRGRRQEDTQFGALRAIVGRLARVRGAAGIDRAERDLWDWLSQWVEEEGRQIEAKANAFDVLRKWTLEARDPDLHALAVELDFVRRYRLSYDLLGHLRGKLPDNYLVAATEGPASHRRLELYPAQSWAVDEGILVSRVTSVATPTGSGKTFLAELRLASEFARKSDSLAVYVAPFNALASQVSRELSERLQPAGWQVQLWTGAYELDTTVSSLGDVLVTTPEKLDFVIRSRLEDDPRAMDLMSRVKSFVFDESHLIAAPVRGIRYELLIARLMSLFPEVSVLTMSAVQPDAVAFADWIAGGEESTSLTARWSPSRPIELLWKREGTLELRGEAEPIAELARPADVKKAAALLGAILIRRLRSVLLVDTRKEWAENLARELFEEHRDALESRLSTTESRITDARDRLLSSANEVRRQMHSKSKLADYLEVGLAFHHAGLPPSIRRSIEELARSELIHTLVSTTTLAEGLDLPFRAVVLVHLNLPGAPLAATTIQNIRGRAGRPFFANEGLFVVVEPKELDTATYQYFRDHYWEERVRVPEATSALSDLVSSRVVQQQEAVRALQSQLLAWFSEEQIEPQEAGDLIQKTYLAAVSGSSTPRVRQVAALIDRQTRKMMEEPALISAASPISLTNLGQQIALGGISAESGWIVREVLLNSAESVSALLGDRGTAWVAIRLAWIPWEAVELSSAYASASHGFRSSGLVRTPASYENLEDKRLSKEYLLSDLLMTPRTFEEIARLEEAREALTGKSQDARVANAIEWANQRAGVLAWTLTAAYRVALHLGEQHPSLATAANEVLPYIRYFKNWCPWPLMESLSDLMDRDSAIRLIRMSGLEEGSEEQFAIWASEHQDEIEALLGPSLARKLMARLENVVDTGDL